MIRDGTDTKWYPYGTRVVLQPQTITYSLHLLFDYTTNLKAGPRFTEIWLEGPEENEIQGPGSSLCSLPCPHLF